MNLWLYLFVLNGTELKLFCTKRYKMKFLFIFVINALMPRTKLFDEEVILEKAMQLFWDKGYAATSLTDLTTHLGIGKGSFYATYNSKQDLFNQAFDLYRNTRIEHLKRLLNSEVNVKIGLRKLLELNLEELLKDDLRKGCFVSNTCSEISNDDRTIREKIVEHQETLEQTLKDYLQGSQIPLENSESIVDTIITFLMGMSQQTKLNRDKKRYLRSIEHILQLLD